jgi:hypothetical protein
MNASSTADVTPDAIMEAVRQLKALPRLEAEVLLLLPRQWEALKRTAELSPLEEQARTLYGMQVEICRDKGEQIVRSLELRAQGVRVQVVTDGKE